MRKLVVILSLAVALCSVAQTAAKKKAAKPEPYKYGVYYYQKKSLFDELPVDSTDIIMLGNSLTDGCEWHELFGMPNIKNRGINSDVIQGIYDRLPSLIAGQPAKIFLMAGTNDVSHNLSADSIAKAYGKLIDYIRATMPNTKLYVQSGLPINISFGSYKGMKGKDQVIRDVNAKISKMAKQKGFTWIDLYPYFADDKGHLRKEFTNDGIHLLAPGYMQWKKCIEKYIRE